MPRPAVRVLHAGVRDVRRRPARAASQSFSAGDRGRYRGQPVPLHGLCVDPALGAPSRSAVFPTCGEGPGWGRVTTRWFGAPVQRVEDDRLLRGHGRFTDDIGEDALECCFVRSPYAHARITSIDAAAARAMPGVVAVYTAADLPFGGVDLPLLIPHPNLTQGRTQRCLASDVVRYAGEAVAFVIAESRYVAEDAAELVQVEYEPLPVVITPEAAARAEHLVHADVPGNVAAEMLQEVGDVEAALACAPHRKRLRLRDQPADHPCGPAAGAVSHPQLPRPLPRPLHKRDAHLALPGRRPPACVLRHGAHARRHRSGAEGRPRRGAAPQPHPGKRVSVR